MEGGVITDLMAVFTASLESKIMSEDEQSQETPEDPLHLLKPCVCILQLLVPSVSTLRKELGSDSTFLLDMFRGQTIYPACYVQSHT